MNTNRTLLRGAAAAALAIGLSAALAPAARAKEFFLTFNGVFSGNGGATDTISGTPFATDTPFTMTALFDNSTTNLVANLPPPLNMGFVSYAPVWVKLSVGGTTYDVATYTQSPTTGFAIDVFDSTSIFGGGHVAIGFNQDPINDGAGIVGDWVTSVPAYTLPNLVPTEYTAANYFGVGFGSGICSGGPGSGIGCATTGIPLDGGLSDLTLGTYDLNNPSNGIPTDPTAVPPVYQNGNLFTASLIAAPEPSTWALLLVGFAALGYAGLRGGKKERLAA